MGPVARVRDGWRHCRGRRRLRGGAQANPGAGLVTLGMGQGKGFLFVVAMLAGMGLFELFELPGRRRQTGPAKA
jgi:hypothetical protein